jgi:small subunit ribosomal protein S29
MKKKAAPVKSGKPPAPGERKAMRKRIVLSNTNALQVEGLIDLSKDIELAVHTGKVVGIPGEVVDSLRAVEAFKVSQGWGMFRRPALLIREESVSITDEMKRAEEQKLGLRLVIDGDRGTGKSLMLLHAMATAFVRGWIVLNIPEGTHSLSSTIEVRLMQNSTAQEVTNAATEYSPIPNTTPTLYSQNTYTANWLSQILRSNNAVLQTLEIDPTQHKLPIPLREKITLARLCELGAREPDISWPIFLALWSEIVAKGRPPVLMTLDGLSHIMRNSLYRSAEFKEIHAHDLVIVKHFVEYLGGKKTLPNGGAVMAATSRSHSPLSKSMELMIIQSQENQIGVEVTPRDPFEREYDPRVEEVLDGAPVMRLGGLSKHEARGLMEYWAQSGVLRQRVDERSVTEKWALAGNGIVGEIQRGVLRMRI